MPYEEVFIAFGALYPFPLFKPVFRGFLLKYTNPLDDFNKILYNMIVHLGKGRKPAARRKL